MTPREPVEELRHPICERDGLGLRRGKDGAWKHKAGRWTARSCGQEPQAIEYVAYLEARPWLLR